MAPGAPHLSCHYRGVFLALAATAPACAGFRALLASGRWASRPPLVTPAARGLSCGTWCVCTSAAILAGSSSTQETCTAFACAGLRVCGCLPPREDRARPRVAPGAAHLSGLNAGVFHGHNPQGSRAPRLPLSQPAEGRCVEAVPGVGCLGAFGAWSRACPPGRALLPRAGASTVLSSTPVSLTTDLGTVGGTERADGSGPPRTSHHRPFRSVVRGGQGPGSARQVACQTFPPLVCTSGATPGLPARRQRAQGKTTSRRPRRAGRVVAGIIPVLSTIGAWRLPPGAGSFAPGAPRGLGPSTKRRQRKRRKEYADPQRKLPTQPDGPTERCTNKVA